MATDTGVPLSSQCYSVGPEAVCATAVAPGSRVVFHCQDASGGQIAEGVREEDIDKAKLFPVAGPVAVKGVVPGDGIGIELLSIVPQGERGSIWTRTGLGVLDYVAFHVRDVRLEDLRLGWLGSDVAATGALHVGTVGVLPLETCLGRDLGGHGGNVDFPRLGVGATLWLTAQVPGGGVFLGDTHAAMGSAEVCGTGVEISANVEARLSVRRDWSPRLPTVTENGTAWLIGIGESVEAALLEAVKEAMRLVSLSRECSLSDAYLAVSSLLIVELCQVVNSSTSVAVTLSGGLSRLLGPSGPGAREREPGDVPCP